MNIKADMKRINKAVKKQYKNHSDSDIKKVKAIRSEIHNYYATKELTSNDLYKRLRHINVILNSNTNFFTPILLAVISSLIFEMLIDFPKSLSNSTSNIMVNIIAVIIFIFPIVVLVTVILMAYGYRGFYKLFSDNTTFAIYPYERDLIKDILKTKYNFTFDYEPSKQENRKITHKVKIKLHKNHKFKS